jgi:hypothetical protein
MVVAVCRVRLSYTCGVGSATSHQLEDPLPTCPPPLLFTSVHAWWLQFVRSRFDALQKSYACTSSCARANSTSLYVDSLLWHRMTCSSSGSSCDSSCGSICGKFGSNQSCECACVHHITLSLQHNTQSLNPGAKSYMPAAKHSLHSLVLSADLFVFTADSSICSLACAS